MRRRMTLSELRWPDTQDFVEVAKRWQHNYSMVMLGYVWAAYDRLLAEVFAYVDPSQSEDDLERNITELLEARIHSTMSGFEPFYVQHSPCERETRQPAPAQPPMYDIAFILTEQPRIMWPIEAKVLRSDGAVADYVKDVNCEFLTCRYAPFSSEGAMLGYLLIGDPQIAFQHISREIPATLIQSLDFPSRPHSISNHTRQVPVGKQYPELFKCHHLILHLNM